MFLFLVSNNNYEARESSFMNVLKRGGETDRREMNKL